MLLEGYLIKPGEETGGYWAVELPLLHIHTQGRSRKEALEMAKDAVECLADKEGFEVSVTSDRNSDVFTVEASDPDYLSSLVLRQTRTFLGLSVRDVAARLKSSSPNSYSQYERGERKPSLGVFFNLMGAMEPDSRPVLRAGRSGRVFVSVDPSVSAKVRAGKQVRDLGSESVRVRGSKRGTKRVARTGKRGGALKKGK